MRRRRKRFTHIKFKLDNSRVCKLRCIIVLLSALYTFQKWVGHWGYHVCSDWLLIYKLADEVMVLMLVSTGTHSYLFEERN